MGTSSNTILDYNLVRFGVCMIKLRNERMLILRCILPPKKLNYLQKKVNPPPPTEKSRTPWQETQVTGNILIAWETLSFRQNISLPPPPPPSKKENLNLQENEKTSLLVKVSTTLKCLNHYEKASNPPLEKFSISQKTLTPSETFLTPLK